MPIIHLATTQEDFSSYFEQHCRGSNQDYGTTVLTLVSVGLSASAVAATKTCRSQPIAGQGTAEKTPV
jgi:hypothetical protein